MFRTAIEKYKIKVSGILHVGANYCQEQKEYESITSAENIHWIEANPEIVSDIKKSHPDYNIYQALLTDKDNDIVEFYISNNQGLSSSIYEFGKHVINHPTIHFTKSIKLISSCLDTFVTINLASTRINVLVLDVQGSELLVLRGSYELLKKIDIIFVEVNIDETYKGCGLVSDIDILLHSLGFKKMYQNIWAGHTYGEAIYLK